MPPGSGPMRSQWRSGCRVSGVRRTKAGAAAAAGAHAAAHSAMVVARQEAAAAAAAAAAPAGREGYVVCAAGDRAGSGARSGERHRVWVGKSVAVRLEDESQHRRRRRRCCCSCYCRFRGGEAVVVAVGVAAAGAPRGEAPAVMGNSESAMIGASWHPRATQGTAQAVPTPARRSARKAARRGGGCSADDVEPIASPGGPKGFWWVGKMGSC